MTTKPLGEARAASFPTHGNNMSMDSPTVGSQSQVPLPAAVPAASGTAAEQQDVDQNSMKPVTSEATSASGDKDKPEAATGHSQEPKKATALLAQPAPDALQTSVSPQNLVWDEQVQDFVMTQSPQGFQPDSLRKEEAPQTAGISDEEQELEPTTPSAKVQSPKTAEAQPAVSSADSSGQPDVQATSTVGTVKEKPEGPEALNPDPDVLPEAKSTVATEGDLVGRSGDLQAGPFSPSPGGSAPPSPGPHPVARERRPLDSSLYVASKQDSSVCSRTSVLGGGEDSACSLADILVWSETTMGLAAGFLASACSSVTDLLHSTRPSLRSVSSILGNATTTFSSSLASGTSLVLRSVTHVLEMVGQMTMEGFRSAVRYLASHLAPRGAHAGSSCD
ncbi:testis-expressed protein 44 [Manis javanica]|uniref:testis-expressed protein 44 n=1 Tax=Manis javanica TaxID=9974 RepID=UPI000812E932|nr:Testis-expressed protein 44 [Manis javanica]